MGQLQLLDVIDGGQDFRCRLHGTLLVELFGRDFTGKCLSELGNAAAILRHACTACARAGAPVAVCNQPLPEKDHRIIDQLVLPLAQDGVRVDRLLVGIVPAVRGDGNRPRDSERPPSVQLRPGSLRVSVGPEPRRPV